MVFTGLGGTETTGGLGLAAAASWSKPMLGDVTTYLGEDRSVMSSRRTDVDHPGSSWDPGNGRVRRTMITNIQHRQARGRSLDELVDPAAGILAGPIQQARAESSRAREAAHQLAAPASGMAVTALLAL